MLNVPVRYINVRLTDREVRKALNELAVGGKAHITLPRLATHVGVSESTIQRSLNRLECWGEIRQVENRGRGGMVYEIK